MINAIAIAMVFSTIGLVMVLPPQPTLVMSSSDGESVLKLTKEVVEDTLFKMEETLVDTKDAVTKGVEVVAKPVEKSMGWFRRKPKLEDQLKMAKEKFDFGKEAINDATTELKDETLEKLNLATQSIKDKIIDDKTLQTNGATKDATDLGGRYKTESTIHKIEQTTEGVAKDEYISTPKILESSQKETFEKIGGTRDSIYDGIGHIKEKLQEVAKGAKDKAHDVGVKTKDIITSNIVEFPKDKVNEGVRHTHDIVIGSLQLGLEKTKEKVKEVVEHSIQDTKEIGYGISERAKDATCKTTECLQSRTQEVGSYLSNLGQGVFGHAYDEGRTSEEEATSIGENIEEIGEDAKSKARDFTNRGMNFARQSYSNMKNIGDHYFDEGRKDHIGKSYDFITDTAQEYYDKVGQHYGRAKDYYDGSTHHHNSKGGGRSSYNGAMDVPSQSFYDDAKDEDDGYSYNIKDKTKHAFDGAYHKTKNSYDNARDKRNGYIPNRHKEEKSGEHISMAKQRIANGYHNVHDQAKDYYKNTKFKPGKDLGAMVESMGWRRVGIVAPDHVPISSNDEVVIGNVKYEWDNKDEHPSHQTTSNSVLNSMKDTTHNMGKRIDLAQEHITKSAQNVQDVGVQGKDNIHDVSQGFQEERSSQLPEHSWTIHGSKHEGYEDDNNNENEDDDYISRRRIRNRGKGRMRNGGHLPKSPRIRRSEYVNLVNKDLLDFAYYDEDEKNMDKGHVLRFWKDTFLRRPEGIFLLLTRALHLFTFSIVYGSSFWVTFVSGFVLSKHIPRQQFGYVQSRIFPMYLRILIAGQSVLFILHSILHPWFIANNVERWELSNFGLMIVSTIINAYILEPQATKVMFERLKVEKEEGRGLENVASPMDTKLLMEEHKKKLGNINQQFKTLHNYSSALNLISLGGLTCHLWQLAHRLVI